MAERIKKKTNKHNKKIRPKCMLSTREHLDLRRHVGWKWRDGNKYSMQIVNNIEKEWLYL